MIRNKLAVDSIITYDNPTKLIQVHMESSLYRNVTDLQEMENKLYDFTLIPGWGLGKPRKSLSYPENARLLSYDSRLISEYINKLINTQRDYSSQAIYLSNLKAKAERLILLLQRSYHLE